MRDRTDEFYELIKDVLPRVAQPSKTYQCCPFTASATVLSKQLSEKKKEIDIAVINELQENFNKLQNESDNSEYQNAILESLGNGIQEAAADARQQLVEKERKKRAIDQFFRPKIREQQTRQRSGFDKPMNITPESEERLQRENQILQMKFANDVDVLRETAKKVEEINSVMTIFSNQVYQHQEKAEHIHHLADTSIGHVEQAEKHLIKAKERSEGYKFYVVLWFIIAAHILLFLDWFI